MEHSLLKFVGTVRPDHRARRLHDTVLNIHARENSRFACLCAGEFASRLIFSRRDLLAMRSVELETVGDVIGVLDEL